MSIFDPYRGLRREIYIIFISKTINAMGALIFPFMTLLLNKKIGLSGAETGLYITLTGLVYAPASLIGGKLADSFGRKPTLIIFELLAACCYVLCIFIEPGMTMVYILMATSFFFGIAGPCHDAMTADLTTPDQREGAYSINYLGFNLGFAFAQIIAGFLFKNHLKIMFLIDASTAFISIFLIGFFIKETLNNTPINIVKNEQKSDLSIFRIILTKPILLFFALASFGYKFIYSQWSFLIPLHAEANFTGEGASLYGLLGSFNAIIVVICTPLITALFKNKTNIRKIFYAGILFFVGFGMLGFISIRTAFFISVFIFTIGEILEAISVMPFIMSLTPSSHRGRMSSVIPMIIGVGYGAGPIIMGSLLDKTSFQFCWIISAFIVLVSTLIMKIIDTKQ